MAFRSPPAGPGAPQEDGWPEQVEAYVGADTRLNLLSITASIYPPLRHIWVQVASHHAGGVAR